MTSKSNSCYPCSDGHPRPLILLCIFIVACFTALPGHAQQATYDFILSGARIVDGTGAAWFYGDVAIKGDRIAAMGDLQKASATERIDQAVWFK